MFLTIESNEEHSIGIDTIVSVLKTNCNYVKLRRFEYSENNLEAIFLIQLTNVDSLKIINSSLLKINKHLKLSFLNQDDSLM